MFFTSKHFLSPRRGVIYLLIFCYMFYLFIILLYMYLLRKHCVLFCFYSFIPRVARFMNFISYSLLKGGFPPYFITCTPPGWTIQFLSCLNLKPPFPFPFEHFLSVCPAGSCSAVMLFLTISVQELLACFLPVF